MAKEKIMDVKKSPQKDIIKRVEEKIAVLEKELPPLGYNLDLTCSAQALVTILEVLNKKELESPYFSNLMVGLAGIGIFKSPKGWKSPCVALCAGLSAIGLIMGGQEKLSARDVARVYYAGAKFAAKFEEEFGSTCCIDLCKTDWSDPIEMKEYYTNQIWAKICYKFVIWAVKEVYKTAKKESKRKWIDEFLDIFSKPKEITEAEVTFYREQQICLVCKGKILGYSYICSECAALYCEKCARALTNSENMCWVCETPIDSPTPKKLLDK